MQMKDKDVRNRIRHYRRQMGLTQTDLAKRLGTTAATVSRLETQGIRISADWLVPLSNILQVRITDLIDEPSPERIEMIGKINPDGTIFTQPGDLQSGFVMRVPATRPIAAKLAHDHGPFRSGELLIGDRFDGKQLDQGLENNCFIGLRDGSVLLRRLLPGPKSGKRFCIAPLHAGSTVKYADRLSWCAPIVMAIRYF